ncbi:MAG: neutral/alkaline non-lysosomal ceramidase N-terminal domain-containing protein, partial [Actinomycetota bacterium]
LAQRVGDRMIVSVPGEMTAGMGWRLKQAVARVVGRAGVRRVVISGLANEYLQYFTTPEEYGAQHYEGGSTLYGEFASNLVLDSLVDLAGRLVSGRPPPEAHPFDPRNGMPAEAPPFPAGAETATAVQQPAAARAGGMATFRWDGGQRGYDRPLDRAFVTIERLGGSRPARVATDLGLRIIWRVDDEGRYTAEWHVPAGTRSGSYRFVITAKRYRVASRPFTVFGGGARATSEQSAAAAFACILADPAVA